MSQNTGGLPDYLLENSEIQRISGNLNSETAARTQYIPELCPVFLSHITGLAESGQFSFDLDPEAVRRLPNIIRNTVQFVRGIENADGNMAASYQKKRRIGIVFSGGPAPGGHNVIAGLFDAARKANPESRIFGFLSGPEGVMEGRFVELTAEKINSYRNLGGFGMIKTGRAKIDTARKMDLARENCRKLELDALVVVGGDDSNTNAAFMAQEFFDDGIQVIGVPKTIDGDVQVRDATGKVLCATSFGFNSAARAFSQEVSNLCTDCSSDMKYWHICKVMGRSASHLALEVALQTHANITLIGEDMAEYTDQKRLEEARKKQETDFTAYGMTLRHMSRVICDVIVRRAAVGKNCGVMVIPEGVLEFINEIQVFILKLNTIIAEYNRTHDTDFHTNFPLLETKREYLRKLAQRSRETNEISIWNTRDDDLFNDVPDFFQEGLLLERDSHGNFQFSLVETDKVIMELVRDYLNILKEKGIYKLGVSREEYLSEMEKAGLNPDRFGKFLFRNYTDGDAYLMIRESIISLKTLKQELIRAGLLGEEENIPAAIKKIYSRSVPQFRTQTHFYGYDGRGSLPTKFDCVYAYNLGWTVFSLVANGATGQMAAIYNLEKPFGSWAPVGLPIAPLMHLEERNGKLLLVLEKSLVDIHSAGFLVLKANREKWLGAKPGPDHYRIPVPVSWSGTVDDDRPLTLILQETAERLLWNASE